MNNTIVPEYKVTFSLVVYKQPIEELQTVIRSLLLYPPSKKIFVIDNSPTEVARTLTDMADCITYRHIPENIGFGRAHNLAIKDALELGCQYHFVVNPDIFFDTDIITPMIDYLDAQPEVGQMMPKILYPDGRTQFLPKLMPSPKALVQRKLKRLLPKKHEQWMQRFEMRGMSDEQVYEVGHVTGCFSVMTRQALEKVGLYDDRFFMYFEDTDMTRRINKHFRTVYFPRVAVYHGYGNGASHSSKLFFIFLSSLVKFFNKWGWFFDNERSRCNRKILSQLPTQHKA